MKRLFIDTATKTLILGLQTPKEDIVFLHQVDYDHASSTVELIKKFLNDNDVLIQEIDEFIVGIGPGSYTGIRVAVMIAKMFAYTLKKPLYTISSIAFLTSNLAKTYGYIQLKGDTGFLGVYDYAKQIKKDCFVALSSLDERAKQSLLMINFDTISINLKNIFANAKCCENIDDLEPNYIRATQVHTG